MDLAAELIRLTGDFHGRPCTQGAARTLTAPIMAAAFAAAAWLPAHAAVEDSPVELYRRDAKDLSSDVRVSLDKARVQAAFDTVLAHGATIWGRVVFPGAVQPRTRERLVLTPIIPPAAPLSADKSGLMTIGPLSHSSGSSVAIALDDHKSLRPYDSVHFRYRGVPGQSACHPSLLLHAERPDGGLLTARGADGLVTREQLSVNVASAPWERKGLAYVVKRELGFAADSAWRYAPAGPYTAVQRRFHQPLLNVSGVKLVTRADVTPRQLNLVVSGETGRKTVIELPLQDQGAVAEGTRVVTISIGSQLANLPREAVTFLDEAVVFLDGDAAIAPSSPLQRFALLEPLEAPSLADMSLSTNARQMHDGWHEVSIDLGRLGHISNIISNSQLEMTAPPGHETCAIQMGEIVAVATEDVEVPNTVQRVEAWASQFGAAKALPAAIGSAYAPEIVAFLPFGNFISDDENSGDRKIGSTATGESRGGVAVDHLFKSPGGATLVQRGGTETPTVDIEAGGPVLSGDAKQVVINWPVQVDVPEHTLFGLRLPGADLDLRRLTVIDGNGRSFSTWTKFDDAIELPSGIRRVKNLRIELEPHARPYALKYAEAALFTVKESSYEEVLKGRLPYQVTSPEDESGPTPESEEPGAAPSAQTRDAKIELEHPVYWPKQITVSYAGPRVWSESACPVHLIVNWTSEPRSEQLCVGLGPDEVVVPSGGSVKRAIRSLEWQVDAGALRKDEQRETVEPALNVAVSGWAARSAFEELSTTPILQVGGHAFFLPRDASFDNTTGRTAIWLPLPSVIANEVLSGAPIRLHGGEFALDTIEARPQGHPTLDDWSRLRRWKYPPAQLTSRVPYGRLALMALGLIAGIAIVRRWRSVGGRVVTVVSGALELRMEDIGPRWSGTYSALRVVPCLLLLACSGALFPRPEFVMVMFAGLILALPTARAWTRLSFDVVSTTAWLVAGLCAAWWLGHAALTRGLSWSLLPLAAALLTCFASSASAFLLRARVVDLALVAVSVVAMAGAAAVGAFASSGSYVATVAAVLGAVGGRTVLRLATSAAWTRRRVRVPTAWQGQVEYFVVAVACLAGLIGAVLIGAPAPVVQALSMLAYISMLFALLASFASLLSRLRSH